MIKTKMRKIFNLSTLLCVMACMNFQSVAAADTLIEFDSPYLIADQVNDKIYAYYGLELPKVPGVRAGFSCNFFLFTKQVLAPGKTSTDIQMYYTEGTYDRRDPGEDLPGRLTVDGIRWTIEMERQPGGCASAAGGGFQKGTATTYQVKGKVPIIGVFVVGNKSHFYNKRDSSFYPRKGFLVNGDVVIAMNREKQYTFVQFTNAKTSNTSTGWIETSNLVDPFPNR